jgi:hypothetical protein
MKDRSVQLGIGPWVSHPYVIIVSANGKADRRSIKVEIKDGLKAFAPLGIPLHRYIEPALDRVFRGKNIYLLTLCVDIVYRLVRIKINESDRGHILGAVEIARGEKDLIPNVSLCAYYIA